MDEWSYPQGIDAELYADFISLGDQEPAGLAERHQRAEREVADAIERLVAAGLLLRRPDGRVAALPPRSAFGSHARRLEHEAELARRQGHAWNEIWQRRAATDRYLDLLTDDDEIVRMERELPRSADLVRALQVGPVGEAEERPKPAVHSGFTAAVGRRARIQVVYSAAVFADADALAAVESCIDLGEEVRVFAQVPFNLLIFDDSVAMVVVAGSGGARRHALLVHPSGLFDSLVTLFDTFWTLGVPLAKAGTAQAADELDEDGRKLVLYLGAGLTDDAIARELGVSERTVGRRVARLQERLGARSRFQLAAQAARRGWI